MLLDGLTRSASSSMVWARLSRVRSIWATSWSGLVLRAKPLAAALRRATAALSGSGIASVPSLL